MRAIFSLIVILGFFNNPSKAQNLAGQYVFHRKGKVSYDYVFSPMDKSFSVTRSGHMGTFYGGGTFEVKDSNLVLNFDSTGVSQKISKGFRDISMKQGGFYIIDRGSETLKIVNIKKRKFDLECDFTGNIETFKRSKYRSKIKSNYSKK